MNCWQNRELIRETRRLGCSTSNLDIYTACDDLCCIKWYITSDLNSLWKEIQILQLNVFWILFLMHEHFGSPNSRHRRICISSIKPVAHYFGCFLFVRWFLTTVIMSIKLCICLCCYHNNKIGLTRQVSLSNSCDIWSRHVEKPQKPSAFDPNRVESLRRVLSLCAKALVLSLIRKGYFEKAFE